MIEKGRLAESRQNVPSHRLQKNTWAVDVNRWRLENMSSAKTRKQNYWDVKCGDFQSCTWLTEAAC